MSRDTDSRPGRQRRKLQQWSRAFGSAGFRNQKKRGYEKGPSFLFGATGEDAFRRLDGKSGIARRATPIRAEIWSLSAYRSRLAVVRRARSPLRATFGRAMAGEAVGAPV